MTNCPHIYPQLVEKGQSSSLCCLFCESVVPGASHAVRLAAERRPHLIVRGRSRLGTALPEANSFLSMCQQFCNIECRRCRGIGAGLTRGNLISTLEQSPARGDTAAPGRFPENAPVSKARRTSLNRACTVTVFDGTSVPTGAGAKWNKERLPWPRASGPTSPTTAAVRACMGSGCGCARAPAAPSSPTVVARAVAHSLRDSAALRQDLARCFRLDTG